MTITRGQTAKLIVNLEGFGDENALGFSLCYDTNLLTFVEAVAGSAVTNTSPEPTFTTNIMHAAEGQLGITLALNFNSGQTLPAGTNAIAEILFMARPNFGSTTATVSFCDSPVFRGISDSGANDLDTFYADSTVSIQAGCFYALGTNAASLAGTGGVVTVNVLAGES